MPDVDAIVVSWNSAPHLGAALAALPPSVRAVVVDNGSADSSVDVARAHGADVVEIGRNIGFSAAVNVGLGHVTAPFTLLLNPDIVVGAGTVERCVEVLRSDDTIGIVGCDTRTPGGEAEPAAARRDRTAAQIVVESLGLVHVTRRFDLQMVHDRDHDRDVDAVNGAFMLLRSDVLRDLGGLDESVFMYLEDMDLCRRVRDRGLRVRFVAGAPAVHEGGASTARGDDAARGRAYLHRIDADVEFLRRHGRSWEPAVAALAYALRSVLGLVVATIRPGLRSRYRAALPFALRQLRGRTPAPPV
jgi:hypothetical protein